MNIVCENVPKQVKKVQYKIELGLVETSLNSFYLFVYYYCNYLYY